MAWPRSRHDYGVYKWHLGHPLSFLWDLGVWNVGHLCQSTCRATATLGDFCAGRAASREQGRATVGCVVAIEATGPSWLSLLFITRVCKENGCFHLEGTQGNENGAAAFVTRAHRQNSLASGSGHSAMSRENDMKYIKWKNWFIASLLQSWEKPSFTACLCTHSSFTGYRRGTRSRD